MGLGISVAMSILQVCNLFMCVRLGCVSLRVQLPCSLYRQPDQAAALQFKDMYYM